MSESGIQDFWTLVKSVWTEGFLGLDIGKIVVALLIFAGFLLVRGLFTRLVIHQIRRIALRTETTVDDLMVEALAKPIRFVPVVMGVFFATNQLAFDGVAASLALELNRSLIAFTIFWALYRVVEPFGKFLESGDGFFTEVMIDWFTKAIRIAVALLGGATVLEIWGIEVLPLVAGLGLFGVAVALGAQDLFKNLIAGLFVIGERRFHRGDWILVDGVVEGTVERIGFRTTKVRRFDKAPVYVPNAELADNAVINFSQMSHRRIKWLISLEYSTDVQTLGVIRDRIEAYILDNPAFAKPEDVATFVRIDRLSDSSIDVLLYCFTVTTDWGEWLEIKETLACKIKQIVEEAGSGFAFPSRTVYLEMADDKAEPIGF
ncbi:MAG: mechanosensitive ion channel family protein [Sphingomonadales bacterium]